MLSVHPRNLLRDVALASSFGLRWQWMYLVKKRWQFVVISRSKHGEDPRRPGRERVLQATWIFAKIELFPYKVR